MAMWQDSDLLAAAQAVRQHAYAPYSKFTVGAALRLRDGTILRGANVENASYGLTLCAERSAVVSGVSAGQLRVGEVTAVVVVADAVNATAPCGACRQVLSEFAGADTPVLLHNARNGQQVQTRVGELLPFAFGAAHLSADHG